MPGRQAIPSSPRNRFDNDPMSVYMEMEYGIKVGDGARAWFAARAHQMSLPGRVIEIELPEKERCSVDALVGKVYELQQRAGSTDFQKRDIVHRATLMESLGEYEYDLSQPKYSNDLGNGKQIRILLEKSLEHISGASKLMGKNAKRDAKIACCLAGLGRYDDAISILENLDANENYKLRSALAISYIGAGRFDDGINTYLDVLKGLALGKQSSDFGFSDFDEGMERAFYAVWHRRGRSAIDVIQALQTIYHSMIRLWDAQRKAEGSPEKKSFRLISFSSPRFDRFHEVLSNLPVSSYTALQDHSRTS